MAEKKDHPELFRVQKWLAHMGVASRREAEGWIREGRVLINGRPASLGDKVDPHEDQLEWPKPQAHPHSQAPSKVYWAFHKPAMTLVSRRGQGEKASIYDLPKLKKLPFYVASVGRLDYMTEGLLLLTNDGELNHRLCHPSYQIERRYQVLVQQKLQGGERERLLSGRVDLADGPLRRARIIELGGQNLGGSRGYWYQVSVFEGRNRLVRRLMESFGLKVIRLVRVGFGEIRLGEDLPAGAYRQLSSKEIKALKQATERGKVATDISPRLP